MVALNLNESNITKNLVDRGFRVANDVGYLK